MLSASHSIMPYWYKSAQLDCLLLTATFFFRGLAFLAWPLLLAWLNEEVLATLFVCLLAIAGSRSQVKRSPVQSPP